MVARESRHLDQLRLARRRPEPVTWRLTLLVVLSLLCGCAIPSRPTGVPETTATPPPTGTPEAAPIDMPAVAETGAITLTLWYPEHMQPDGTQAGGRVLQSMYHDFADMYPDLGIVGETKKSHGPSGILDYLRATSRVKPGALPDLVLLPMEDLAAAASLGVLQPLDSVLLDLAVEDLYPFANESGLFEGERLAIPYEVDIRILAYDAPTVGSVPLAWSESLTLAGAYLVPLAEPELAGADALLLQYYALGGTLYDDEANLALDEADLTEALTLFEGLYERGLIHSASLTTTNLADAWSLFAAGDASVAETSAHQFASARAPGAACAPVPTADGNPATLVEGWAWAIATSDPRRQQGALALLSWLMEAENLASRCAASSFLPARRSAAELTLDGSACADTALQLLEHAHLRPPDTCGAIRKWSQAAIQEVLAGVETPELAAAEIASYVTQLCQAEAAAP